MSVNRLFHGSPVHRLIVSVDADTVAAMDAALHAGHPPHGNRSEFIRLAIRAELVRRCEPDNLCTPSRARRSLGPGAAQSLFPARSARGNNFAGKRVPCGARRRRDGKPCEALSVPGKRRCKWHGGMSTGPKTPEGKAKVTRNLPRRGP